MSKLFEKSSVNKERLEGEKNGGIAVFGNPLSTCVHSRQVASLVCEKQPLDKDKLKQIFVVPDPAILDLPLSVE